MTVEARDIRIPFSPPKDTSKNYLVSGFLSDAILLLALYNNRWQSLADKLNQKYPHVFTFNSLTINAIKNSGSADGDNVIAAAIEACLESCSQKLIGYPKQE